MNFDFSKPNSMPKIDVFGNGFRLFKTKFCAQNLGVEMTFDFCTLKVFSLEVLVLKFLVGSLFLKVHGKVYFGSLFDSLFESLCENSD